MAVANSIKTRVIENDGRRSRISSFGEQAQRKDSISASVEKSGKKNAIDLMGRYLFFSFQLFQFVWYGTEGSGNTGLPVLN